MAYQLAIAAITTLSGVVLSDYLNSKDIAKLNEAISRMDRTELAGLSLMMFLCSA